MIEVKDKVPENPDFVLNQLKRLISYSKIPTGMETNPYVIQSLQQRSHGNRRLCGRS